MTGGTTASAEFPRNPERPTTGSQGFYVRMTGVSKKHLVRQKQWFGVTSNFNTGMVDRQLSLYYWGTPSRRRGEFPLTGAMTASSSSMSTLGRFPGNPEARTSAHPGGVILYGCYAFGITLEKVDLDLRGAHRGQIYFILCDSGSDPEDE